MALELGASKANLLAIVKEVTEGTPVDPSSGSDFIAVQPDVSMTPNFEVLQNDEIRSSIGSAKPIQGLERPEMSGSQYMKHSGTEGVMPKIGKTLESLFGSTSTNSTERSTTTSSTTTLIKAAAGGSDFARGKAVLIKDGVNGYRIRPVHEVATNDLTLGFAVPTGAAPGTGIALGKCINFTPVNNSHPSLSAYLYRGNGQAIEVISGLKCTQMSMSAQAGQFLNSNFTLVGAKYHYNPIRISSTNKYIDFDDGSEKNASIPEKLYRDPLELAQAIQDAMNALTSDNITVTYNSKGTNKGKFTFTSDGSTFELLWNTGANTANSIGTTIGFLVAADDTSALTYTSDNVKSWAAPYQPSYDTADPLVVKNQEVLFGNQTDFDCFQSVSVQADIGNERTEVKSICSESGVQSNIVTARTATVQITALLDKGEAENFKRYRANDEVRFCYNFGEKSGGNWIPGKCGSLYIPTAVISSFNVVDLDSVVAVEIGLTAFVDENGNGEVYLNFV